MPLERRTGDGEREIVANGRRGGGVMVLRGQSEGAEMGRDMENWEIFALSLFSLPFGLCGGAPGY